VGCRAGTLPALPRPGRLGDGVGGARFRPALTDYLLYPSPPMIGAESFFNVILSNMDHLEVLREKIGRLRAEIAQLQELNNQYRRERRNDAEAQVAHGQRHERLQAIQRELSQLADLGRRVRSIEEMKEQHRARIDQMKKAS